MLKQLSSTIRPLDICSRCLNHEINSWVNENWSVIDEETKKQIREELKAIKLKQGKCLVCNNFVVSEGAMEKILEILEENNISSKIKDEFRKSFFVILTFEEKLAS